MIPSTIRKINEKMKSQIIENDIMLLSELNLEPSERQFIRDNSATILEKALEGVAEYNLSSCYYMMDVGQREYNDGMYWDNFWRLSDIEKRTTSKQSKLSDLFKSTIEDHGLAWVERGGRTYVNMILMHAFIPDEYSSKLFDFMYMLYDSVLNGSLDGMDEALNNLADETSVENNEDKGSIFDTALIVPMKLAFSDFKIFGPVAKKILIRINSPEDEGTSLGIHESSFKKWIAEKLAGNLSKGKIGGEIRMHFDIKTMIFRIFIPEILFHGQGEPYAYIKDGKGKVFEKIRLRERTFQGYTLTEHRWVNLREYGLNPFDNFTITAGNRKFESSNVDYLIFSYDGKSSRNLSRGVNYVARKPEVTIDTETSVLHENDNLIVNMLYLERGDSVKINGIEYLIHKPFGDFFDISDNELNLLCTDSNGDEWSLYPSHPSISLESEEDRLDLLRLTVWKDESKIRELDFKKCRESLPPGYKVSFCDKVHVELDLETILRGYGEGVYKFKFNRSYKSLKYLYIPGFTCTFDKEVYFGENGRLVINWNVNDSIEFNSARDDKVTFPFESSRGRVYDITVDIPSFRYSFNRKDWLIFNSKKYYYKDLKSDLLHVKTPDKDGGYLSISVSEASPLKGVFENGVNTFNLTEITKIAPYVNCPRFLVYYNWGVGQGMSKMIFPISVNAGYIIADGQVRVVNNVAGNVSYRLVIDYENGDSATVSFEDGVAEFDEEGFEEITVDQITVDDFGMEDVRKILLVPKEIDVEIDSSAIRRNVLPESIGYHYGTYEGELNPKYFESMIADEWYSDDYRGENLEDLFLKNAYGERMPDVMARKLYGEVEAQILKIQTDTECKHSLIRLFNKYVNVRKDFAKTVLNRLETLYPDDATLQHLKWYV